MRTLFVCLSILLITVNVGHTAQYWAKTYGEEENDHAYSIQQTLDGGYIIAIHSSYYPPLLNSNRILKLDSSGVISWQKSYQGFGGIYQEYNIQQTSDGGYIVAGVSSDFESDVVLKLYSDGNINWQKEYGEGSGKANFINQTADGGYIVAGGSLCNDPYQNFHVMKLDSSGNITWQKCYGGDSIDYIHAIQQTPGGGYILAGRTNSFGAGSYDFWVIKLDDNGDVSWQRTYGGIYNEIPYSIQLTNDGGYIVAGHTWSFGAGQEDIWIIKLDVNGDISWQKTYGRSYGDNTHSIQQTSDGGYVLAGSLGFQSGILGRDMLVLKLDENGNITWQKTYRGGLEEYAHWIQQIADGGYIVAGYTSSFGAGNIDILLLKLDSNGEIPQCDIMYTSNIITSDTSVLAMDPSSTVQEHSGTITEASIIPQDISVEVSTICFYDTTDFDSDGLPNDEDNCPETPNSDQLDTFPPQGNEIGDACDCEGNFDCDEDCDGTDAASFKGDFGRSSFLNPCINENQCHGDFDCDVDVDGTDAALFKVDFGRSSFLNPCPVCVVGEWCVYP